MTELTERDIDRPQWIFDQIVYDSPYAFYLTQWIDYHNVAKTWRLKMPHEIKLKDGSEHIKCWPNANSWHCSTGRFEDDDVEFIKLANVHPMDDDRD